MRISDWSSDVCSSDLVACYRFGWPRLPKRPPSRWRMRRRVLSRSRGGAHPDSPLPIRLGRRVHQRRTRDEVSEGLKAAEKCMRGVRVMSPLGELVRKIGLAWWVDRVGKNV